MTCSKSHSRPHMKLLISAKQCARRVITHHSPFPSVSVRCVSAEAMERDRETWPKPGTSQRGLRKPPHQAEREDGPSPPR